MNFKKYIKDFKNVGKREKIIIFSILLASFAIGVTGSYMYRNLGVRKASSTPEVEFSVTPLPKTSLITLESEKGDLATGNKFDVNLNLNSGNLGVEAADFVVNFDPDYLKAISVSTGTFFKNYPINTTGDNFVKISGVADFTEKAVVVPKGEGTVATITFETLQATESTKIEIDKIKTIIASGGQNILDTSKLEDLMISVTE